MPNTVSDGHFTKPNSTQIIDGTLKIKGVVAKRLHYSGGFSLQQNWAFCCKSQFARTTRRIQLAIRAGSG